ncbi:glutamyl-tRNA reductase [Ulvibacterium sp.]|uniref:glutamyl-tRNA reductase n=1 Tax=Ulvibacterium sp. TaxID=2665914 RepID=UPI003BAD4782
MEKSLRYISISHKTASVAQREVFHIPKEEKEDLVAHIRGTFPDISGLLLLVTCNRTELYFESTTTPAVAVRNYLIRLKSSSADVKASQLFRGSDATEKTVRHLLEVSSGLASSVIGDVEIVHQIKKAYHFSMQLNLQGSLLERAMQTVFKSHKRISNETLFRDGTTSMAYKALKVINHTYDKTSAKEKKIVFIGAGDIVMQLFKYNSKFNFKNIYISNRTEEKANALAKRHGAKVLEWSRVLRNDFRDFDVIIGAASNCAHLVKSIPEAGIDPVLLIDLAVPCNIDKDLSRKENVFLYDLDTISMDLEDTKEKRMAAIGKVGDIIAEELGVYTRWLQRAPLRSFLAEYKILVNQKVMDYFETDSGKYDPGTVKMVTDRVIRRVKKRTDPSMSMEEMDAVIAEQVSFL